MAGALPDPLERRNLLYADGKKAVDLAALAERYLEAGRKSDALDFADRLQDPVRREAIVSKLREAAVSLGDFFLLNRIDASKPLDEDTWRKALGNAKAQGKQRHALKIARKLNDAAEIEALEVALRPPGWVPPPATEPSATPAAAAGEEARPV